MARFEPDPVVTLSVLDRLIDLDPNTPADAPPTRSHSLRHLKASLKRDLEWLLNTRRTPEEITESSSELYRSLYNYGLPDFASLGLRSSADQNRLLWALEAALAVFEPRVQGTRVTLEPLAPGSRVLRFQIQGMLRIDPAPERVTFDTMLELSSGEYEVRSE